MAEKMNMSVNEAAAIKSKMDDIKSSINVLSGLLGYSERLGLVSDTNERTNEESACYAREYRVSYENALKTAIEVLAEKLDDC